jgi:hypothetical protein
MIAALALAAALHGNPAQDGHPAHFSRIDNVELILDHGHCEFGSLPVFHIGCQDYDVQFIDHG